MDQELHDRRHTQPEKNCLIEGKENKQANENRTTETQKNENHERRKEKK